MKERIPCFAALACTFVSLAVTGGAMAAEPGWGPVQPLPGADTVVGQLVRPLPGGRFLVLYQVPVDRMQQFGFDARLAEIDSDGAATTTDVGPTSQSGVDVATSATGDARIAWLALGDNRAIIRTQKRSPDGTLGAPQEIDPPQFANEMRVAMDRKGNSVIAYDDAWGTVYATFISAAGATSSPVVVAQVPQQTDVSTSLQGVEVGLGDNGEAVVAWSEGHSHMTCQTTDTGQTCTSDRTDYLLRTATGTSAGFAQPVTLDDVDGQSPAYDLASDASGGAAIGWQRPTDNAVRASLRAPGGAFAAPVDLGPGAMPSVAVTPDGKVVVAYATGATFGSQDIAEATGSTADGHLDTPITGETIFGSPRAAAGWSGERAVAWQAGSASRAVWIGAGGAVAPARDVACDRGAALGAAVSDGHALELFGDYTPTPDGYGASRLSFALAEPEITPGGLACPRATPGSPAGPPVQPAPFQLPYFAYDSRHRRFSTSLLSPPAGDAHASVPKDWSNGESDHTAFSQDNRDARLVAFDSMATNLVAGDRNRHRDVFVVRRARGGGNLFGTIAIASVGMHGEPANGDSSRPSLDGETHASPHCVTFQSTATNLAGGDPSPDSDVYLRDLRAGRTILLSRGLRDASDPVVDGRCRAVTFEAGGSVWVAQVGARRPLRLARGTEPDQQTNGLGAAYARSGQVFYRSYKLRRGRLVRGRERLVSATPQDRPGNGASSHPALDDAGYYAAFESTATDLCDHTCVGVESDRNGHTSDVFRRTLSPHAPTHDRMEMATYSYANKSQLPYASHDPVMSAAGENIVFDAEGGPYRSARRLGIKDARVLYTWEFPRARGQGNVRLVKRHCRVFTCNDAPTTHPSMSSRGNYIAFSSIGTEFCADIVRLIGGRDGCPTFTDVYIQYVGPSHEGRPLG